MRGSRGGGGYRGPDPPPEKSHKYMVLSNTGPDPRENSQKATKPVFNVRPSSARKRNAIPMAFRLRADGGPVIVVFGFFRP